RGSKTVWIKCGNKGRVGATAVLLGDSVGNKYAPFLVFKRTPDVLLLWDDFGGPVTAEVVQYAASINVILLKVPPRYTYVCQPADITWIQPLKHRLRKKWIQLQKKQLILYKKGVARRQKTNKRHWTMPLQNATETRTRKTLLQLWRRYVPST
ncbi:hypothetical protein JG688_00017463, partial [Phytophthora aleatoria]